MALLLRPDVASKIAPPINCLGSACHYWSNTSQGKRSRNTVSFLWGEALGCIAVGDMSHRKCQGIMCDQQDLAVEGQLFSCPAERHGLSRKTRSLHWPDYWQNRGAEMSQGLSVYSADCQHLNVFIKWTIRVFLMYTAQVCWQFCSHMP